MLIAHLSDFHIFTSAASESALVRPDIIDVTRTIIADVAAFRPTVDAVMLTGDLADGGTPQDYAVIRELLAPLSMPIFAVPGNHDRREGFREAFKDRFPFESGPFLHYETRFRDIRILALDTILEPGPGGELCPKRLAWIEERLARPWDGMTIILMHHAPYITGIRFLDNIGLTRGRREFGEIIARQKGDLRIFAGHVHRPSQTSWKGALTTIAGSVAFKIELDLHAHDDEPPQLDEPYAYFIHHLDASGDVAVHPRFVHLPPDGRPTHA